MKARAQRIEQLAREAAQPGDAEQALHALAELRRELDALEPDLVTTAVRHGASWSRIAAALGVSKQAAHRKHRAAVAMAAEDAAGPPRVTVADDARQCVHLAVEEARGLGAPAVGTEHLLLGILRLAESPAARALATLGVTLQAARDDLQGTIVDGQPAGAAAGGDEALRALGRRRDLTPHAHRILEGALREALNLRDGYMGVEHLLLALLADRRNGAVRTLEQLGVSVEQIRAQLRRARPPARRRAAG